MRAHRIFLSFALAMGCGITLQSTAFSQEYRGTWEQQQACTPDVWRLCGAQIPDVDRIVACLRRNTPQLSDRCRAVFAQGDKRPRVVRIATTGKGVTIEIMGQGVTTGTTGLSGASRSAFSHCGSSRTLSGRSRARSLPFRRLLGGTTCSLLVGPW